jgi:formyl-CoA transferase
MLDVYYRTYATKDAAMAVACVSAGLQRALMKAVGLTDAAHERPIGDHEPQARHYAELGARMEARLASRTAAEWKAVFDAHGIPAGAVKLPFEMLEDAQALANGFFHDLAHPVVGTVRVLAPPLRLDGEGFRPQPATPAFGSQTRAILGELGFPDAEISALLEGGVTRDALPDR